MARGHLVLEHALDQIQRGHQYRKDLDDDLDALCESIQRAGILNPPAVTEGFVLITGNRRVAAMERLGWRVTPVWVVPGVSDKLTYVLAVRDEQTLHKALKPIEQAELYEELKALYAEDAERRKAATQFRSGTGDGGADSAPPADGSGGGNDRKSRVQAARAVTGRDSRTMLEQINELKRIAAADDEDPYVRQHAAEALIELNQDGKVNGRFQAVKAAQHTAALNRLAQHPDTPEPVRDAAARELETLTAAAGSADAAKEAGLALARVQQLHTAATSDDRVGWKDVDPLMRQKHQIRKLVDQLRREHGWWDRYDPAEFGEYADAEQWALVEEYVAGANGFLTLARSARAAREQDDADL